jgi:hypothetical protein
MISPETQAMIGNFFAGAFDGCAPWAHSFGNFGDPIGRQASVVDDVKPFAVGSLTDDCTKLIHLL